MVDLSFPIGELEIFLLILVRVVSFIYTSPFFGMNNTPARTKISFGVFFAYLIYQITLPHDYVVYDTLLQYALIVVKEALCGIMIGLAAQLCMSIVSFAGRIVDMEIGFSMVSQLDPTTNEQTSITGIYFQYMVILLLIITGLHQYLIRAFIESYTLIPISGQVFHKDLMLQAMINYITGYIFIGFRICLPTFAVSILLNAILGILAKTAPQLNMFAVGMQLKVLLGLVALFASAVLLPDIANFISIQMKTMVTTFVEVMMP